MIDRQSDPRRRLLVALALERSRSPHAPEGPIRRVLEGGAPRGPRHRVPGSSVHRFSSSGSEAAPEPDAA